MTLILSNDDVEKLLTMRDCIEVMEEVYVELAEGRGVSRTRSDCFTPTARADALYSLKSMDGVIPKLGIGAVRINSDIITWPKRGNNMRREKVPAAPNNRYVGLVLLFSVENGEPLAILPDGVMQRMRVGATNGLGIKYLARRNAKLGRHPRLRLAGGCAAHGGLRGAQHRHASAASAPMPENCRAFAASMSACLGIEVEPVEQPEAAIAGADIVMCATNSIDHVFFARWIEPGMHLSSIKRPEIEVAAIQRADRVVIHSQDASPDARRRQGLRDRGEGRRARLAAGARRSISRRCRRLPT